MQILNKITMKKLIFVVFLLTTLWVNAENRVKIAVDCQTPGTLSSLIPYIQQKEVTDLFVSGYINKTDFTFINQIAALGNLKVLDLSKSTSTDGYMRLSHNLYITDESGNSIIGYKTIGKVSMPISDKFTLSLGEQSYIDTLQINSKCVVSAYGNDPNQYRNHACSNIKKIILGENVEEISENAFRLYFDIDDYLIDAFPESLKVIRNGAFREFYRTNHYSDPGISKFVNPNIKWPGHIEEIGGSKDMDVPDYLSSSYGSWNNSKMTFYGKTISLPESLKIFNGQNRYKGSPVELTKFECDTIILHDGLDYFSASVKAKVIICNIKSPENINFDLIYVNKLYVPQSAFDKYKTVLSWDVDVNNKHVQEILPIVEVSRVKIKGVNTIYAGETTYLESEIFPEDAINHNVKWESSNDAIASINSEGIVSAMKAGLVTITATSDNGICGYHNMEVLQHPIGFEITPAEVSIESGSTLQIQCIFSPADVSNKKVKWESSTPEVCHVSDSGMITALNPGISVITATTDDGNLKSYCKVTVVKTADSISVSPKTVKLNVGDSVNLEVTMAPSFTSDKSVTWESSNPNIANVNEYGEVAAISTGIVKIIAMSNSNPNLSDFSEITVIQPVEGITLSMSEVNIVEDNSIQLEAIITPFNATNKNVKWTSSDPSVAVVSGSGMVYGIKSGESIITATSDDGGYIAMCKVSVLQVSGIELILSDLNTDVTIYDLNGYKVFEGKYNGAKFKSGVYIVVYNGKQYKVMIN